MAKTLVNVRGGPEIFLFRSSTDEADLRPSDGVFRAKLMLETLAVYDIFGGYTNGRGGVLRAYLTLRRHCSCASGVTADDPVFFPHILTGCLSTGSEPTLLAPGVDSWWYVSGFQRGL